jgi:hypothetical protein
MIIKAEHVAENLVADLRAANKTATALESIILMELIKKAALLRADIQIFLEAKESEATK